MPRRKHEIRPQATTSAIKKKKVVKPKSELLDFMYWFVMAIGTALSALLACLLCDYIVVAPIDPVAYNLGEYIPLEGVLALNDRLNNVEVLLDNQIYGPESIAIDPRTGYAYTGLKTGLIVEIDMNQNKILKAVKLAELPDGSCDGSYASMPKCGRPLGMRFNHHDELLVADAYLGLYKINFRTQTFEKLFGAGDYPVNEKNAPPVRYINDLDVLPDGRVVISESSTKFDDRDYFLEIFEHRPNGRLLIYDPRTTDLRVLKSGLYFPNGVQVVLEKGAAKDAPFRVFFSELGMARINAVWVPQDTYAKALDSMKVVTATLPGYPDNIRLSKSGHLLVAIPCVRSKDEFMMETRPHVRSFMTKVLSRSSLLLVLDMTTNTRGFILKIDAETGQIVEAFHDTNNRIYGVTSVIEDNDGNLLLGNDVGYALHRIHFDDDWKSDEFKTYIDKNDKLSDMK